jgi:hypothetical protein
VRSENRDDEARHEAGRSEALSQYQHELGNRDRKLGELSKSQGPESADWQDCERQLKIDYESCQSKALALSRATDAKRASGVAMAILFLGLCAFETPVNKFMFDILLALQNWESYVISFVMSFGLLCLAHVAGFQARQIKGDFEDKFYFGKIAVTIFLLAFLMIAVAVLTVCRAYASTVATTGASFDIFSHVIAQVRSHGAWSAVVTALEDQSAVMLAAFNLTGIACAFILSFITHDSDAVYQASIDAQKASQKKFSIMSRKYDREISKVEKKFSPKLGRYATAFSAHNAKVVALRRTRNAPITELDNFDVNSLDKTLVEARRGIGDRVRYLNQSEPSEQHHSADSSQMASISQRERRA